MRTLILLALVFLLSVTPCSALEEQGRVLFVGNSLTYVGNLPAVFSALAEANGKPIASDMIVRGGATLTDRVVDGSVAQALSDKKYTAIVLQERGGDLMCLFGRDSCVQSRLAIKTLVKLANETDTKVVLLGTYQLQPDTPGEVQYTSEAIKQILGIISNAGSD